MKKKSFISLSSKFTKLHKNNVFKMFLKVVKRIISLKISFIYLMFQEDIFPFLLPYLLPLIHITLTGSVYTTIAVAVERCVTVLAPFTQLKVNNAVAAVAAVEFD